MPIIGAALVPHFPLLIKNDANKSSALLEPIHLAVKQVSSTLRELRPDTIVIVSPHGIKRSQFQGFVSDHVTVSLKTFGDITHATTFKENYLPLFQLKKRIPKDLVLVSSTTINYAAGVPLLMLTEGEVSPPEVTVLHTSTKSFLEHFSLGSELRETLEASNKTYYIIASGDFARYSVNIDDAEEKASFADKLVLQSLRTNNIEQLLHPSEHPEYLEEWVCGVKPLCVLLGALGGTNYTTTILSYDHSLEIGLAVAEFKL